MNKLKITYEIVISGIYLFEGEYEKNGFKIVENSIDPQVLENLLRQGIIYISPFFKVNNLK